MPPAADPGRGAGPVPVYRRQCRGDRQADGYSQGHGDDGRRTTDRLSRHRECWPPGHWFRALMPGSSASAAPGPPRLPQRRPRLRGRRRSRGPRGFRRFQQSVVDANAAAGIRPRESGAVRTGPSAPARVAAARHGCTRAGRAVVRGGGFGGEYVSGSLRCPWCVRSSRRDAAGARRPCALVAVDRMFDSSAARRRFAQIDL